VTKWIGGCSQIVSIIPAFVFIPQKRYDEALYLV
jgi:hypothetical protein